MEPNPDIRMGYTMFAALSGAITSLAFMRWREMDWRAACLTVFVGFTFSVFGTPWIVHDLLGVPENNERALSIGTYLIAAGAHIIIPALIKKFMGQRLGGDDQ